MKYLAFVALAQSFFCYLEAVGTDGILQYSNLDEHRTQFSRRKAVGLRFADTVFLLDTADAVAQPAEE